MDRFNQGYIIGKASSGGGSAARVYTNFIPPIFTHRESYAERIVQSKRLGWGGVGIINNIAYVFGGAINDAGFYNTTDAFDLETMEKTSKNTLSEAKRRFAYVEHDGLIYCIGGQLINGDAVGTLEVYDYNTNLWTVLQPMTTARYFCAASVYNGKIYVTGGNNGSVDLLTNESYDIVGNTWSPETDLPATERERHLQVTIGDKIHLIGGIHSFVAMDNHDVYDPVLKTWSTLEVNPNSQYAASGGRVGDEICVFGGNASVNIVSVYSTSGGGWITYTFDNLNYGYRASSIYNNRLYLFGGATTSLGQFINSIYEFIPSYIVDTVPSGTKVTFDKIIWDGTTEHPANVEFTTTAEVQLSSFETDLTGTITYP